MKLLGYIRRSRDNGSGVSEAQQEAEIRQYCAAYGHKLVMLPPDLDESGSKLDRPSMTKAQEMLAAGKADGIIAAKLDRLSRNVSDFDGLVKRAKAEGWSIIVLDLAGVDLASENGQMIAGVVSVIAQWDWNRKRGYLETSRRDAILVHGVHGGSRAPLGYDWTIRETTKSGEELRGPLTPNADAPKVTSAFAARAEGASWMDVIQLLGVKSQGHACSIIEARVYLGEARSGDFVKEGAHPALVDETTWRRANRQRTPRSVSYKRRAGALLGGGIVRCASCGYAMTHNGAGHGDHYRCMRHTCPEKASIQARLLEPFVLLHALTWHATTNPLHISDLDDAARVVFEERLADADGQVAEVDRMLADGEVDAVTYAKASASAQRTRSEAMLALADAEASKGWLGMTTEAVQRRLFGDVLAAEADEFGPAVEGIHGKPTPLSVEEGRDFVRQMVRVTVRPVGRGRKVAVRDRVDVQCLTPAAALADEAFVQVEVAT